MAWEWSHTGVAYLNAERNLLDVDRPTLVEIYAEWQCCRRDKYGLWDSSIFEEEEYTDHVHNAHDMGDEQLIDHIWKRVEEYRTCDSGGNNAWVCPYGCHTVSFSLPEEK